MKFYTPAQVAALANVSLRTVCYEVQRGNLRRTKIGRAARFAEADVLAWLNNGRA